MEQAPLDFALYAFSFDIEGLLTWVSSSWQTFMQCSESDVLGCSWLDYFHMPSEQWTSFQLSQQEHVQIVAEAGPHSLTLVLTLLRREHHFDAYFVEIPVLMQQRKQIEWLNKRLKAVYQASNQSIVILDLQHRILDFNQSAADVALLRFGRHLKIQENFLHYVQPDRHDDFYQSFAQALRGNPVFKERLIYAPDGQGVSYEMSYTPIYNPAHEISSVCFMSSNVEEQRQIRTLLNYEQSFAHSILNATNALILVLDDKGKIVRFNKACERLSGYRAEEVREQIFWECLIPEDEQEKVRQAYTASSQSETLFATLKSRDGRLYPIHWSLHTMQGLEEQALYTVSTGIDLTEQQATAQALQESESLLLQAQKMDAIGQMAGSIAHDFNNMLTSIGGYGQLLQQTLSPHSQATSYLCEILKTCEKAKTLTRDLLMFSRKADLEMHTFDLNLLIGETEGLLAGLLPSRITLELRLSPELTWVNGNSLHLEQVLMNLLVNSRDAIASEGVIRISTSRCDFTQSRSAPLFGTFSPGSYVCLQVSDTGMGMDSETLKHIFEPFFSTKEKGKGTGLGLMVVYRVVKESLGFIEIESTIGKGTLFSIFLPYVGPQQILIGSKRLVFYRLSLGKLPHYIQALQTEGFQVELVETQADLIKLLQENEKIVAFVSHLAYREECLAVLPRGKNIPILYITGDSPEEMETLEHLRSSEDVLLQPFSALQLRYRLDKMV